MIPACNSITAYFHCAECAAEVTAKHGGIVALMNYARFEVGLTDIGVQVWCRRHRSNVIHISFAGHELPMTMDTEATTERALNTIPPEDCDA